MLLVQLESTLKTEVSDMFPSKARLAFSCCVGKTQLVKGKLAQLPEDMASLSISFNYFTDVISFQKILESPLEKKVNALSTFTLDDALQIKHLNWEQQPWNSDSLVSVLLPSQMCCSLNTLPCPASVKS